jgi:hypothetical protein
MRSRMLSRILVLARDTAKAVGDALRENAEDRLLFEKGMAGISIQASPGRSLTPTAALHPRPLLSHHADQHWRRPTAIGAEGKRS